MMLRGLPYLKSILFLCAFVVSTAFGATISSIQKGTVTIGAGSGSTTQAITSVNLTQSFLVFSINTNSNRPGASQIGGRMTSSTLLTFDRFDVGGTPAVEIVWEVFEFSSGVTVQRGVATNVPNAGTNVTITSVTTSESFATANMRKDGGQYGSDDFITADITSSTNLYLDRDAGGANPQNVYWQVIEWSGASVQKINATLADGSDSLAVTLGTAVDKAKTMIIGNYRCSGNVDAADFACSELVDNNTVSFSRVDDTRNLAFVYYVVEFSDNTDVIHGSIRMTAAQDNISTTICSVSTTLSGIISPNLYFRSGANCEDTDDDVAVAYANFTLASATSVNATRSAAGFAAIFPFQVLEFTAATPSGCVATEPGASTPRTIDLCSIVLPIELLKFTGQLNEKAQVDLDWLTASERNNAYFEVERSRDGIHFESLGKLSGAGNSVSELNYYLVDPSPYFGISYYRLKQVDFDENYSYSDLVSVELYDSEFTLYPNPTSGELYISENVENPNQVQVFNSLGQNIPIAMNYDGQRIVLDLSELPNGIYFVQYDGAVKRVAKY